MAEQYINDVATWAKHYHLAASIVEEFVFENEDGDESILAFRVRFASGHKVVALSSRPANLRAKKGCIVIDEAAFHDDLPELLKAAIAIKMWGGRVAIISTHDGTENHFNEVCDQIRAGELNYSLHRTTLDDALADGLYQRICLVQGKGWTPEAEAEWRQELIDDYGIAADEELFCRPFAAGAGLVFHQDWLQAIHELPDEPFRECRYWDFAATEKKLKSPDPCYTAGVKMRYYYKRSLYVVMDCIAVQIGPAEIDRLVMDTAISDGFHCMVRWEMEGGSAGPRDAHHLVTMLQGFDAEGTKPQGDKVTRAKPLASQCKAGNVRLMAGHWNKRFKSWYHAFPDGKVKDPIDAGSGAFAILCTQGGIEYQSTGTKRSALKARRY